jgi:hypothetical protein
MYRSSGSVWPARYGSTVHVDSSAALSTGRPAEQRTHLVVLPTRSYGEEEDTEGADCRRLKGAASRVAKTLGDADGHFPVGRDRI